MRKCLNYDSFDPTIYMIGANYHHANPLIIKITVQTSISENFKKFEI